MPYRNGAGTAVVLLTFALAPTALGGQERDRPLGQEVERDAPAIEHRMKEHERAIERERERVEADMEHQRHVQELRERSHPSVFSDSATRERAHRMRERVERLAERARHLHRYVSPPERDGYMYRYSFNRSCGRMGIRFDGDDGTIEVREVVSGSPAERAGVIPGDTILRVNGRDVAGAGLLRLAERLAPGDTVQLTLRRSGVTREISLIAEEDVCRVRQVLSREPFRLCQPARPDADPDAREAGREACDEVFGFQLMADSLFIELDSVRIFAERGASLADSLNGLPVIIAMRDSLEQMLPHVWRQARTADEHREFAERMAEEANAHALFARQLALGHRAIAGAQLQELNPSLAEYFDVEAGVLVTEVAPRTPAAEAGMEPGDVITGIGGERVPDIRALRTRIADAQGEISLDLVRKGRNIELRLPD